MSQQADLDAFLDQLIYARGLSPQTKEAYASDIAAFLKFLGKKESDFKTVSRADIARFLEAEFKTGFADTTRARRLIAIKVFFTWLFDEGTIPSNPAEALSRPHLWQHLPDTLTEKQVDQLLDGAWSDDDRLAVRNRAMLELLYACGLRASEMISLKLDDVHIAEAYLRCTGKGSKQRVVPIGVSAINSLQIYLEDARPKLVKDDSEKTFFLSNRGGPMVRETLWRIVTDAAQKSGLAGEVHPHTLRHCFATHLLSHGANIRAIQEMLGHANIATTQIYTHVDAEKLLETHRRFHPRP